MVCEKNRDSQHDFMNDPLKLYIDNGWVKADGTTLGADNGIGVAAAMALLDLPENTPLPPLECLFTVDEETGLTGAFALNGEILKGRTMLNLEIIKSDFENNLIYLKGSIPGSKNTTVILRESIKQITKKTIKEKYDAKLKAAAAKKGKK